MFEDVKHICLVCESKNFCRPMLFEDDALKFVCPLLIKSVDVRILGILRWTKSQLMGYSHCSDTKLKIIRDLQILNLWAESLALSSGSVQHPTSKEEEKAARKKSWENDNGGGGTTGKKNWLSCQEQWSCVGKFFSVFLLQKAIPRAQLSALHVSFPSQLAKRWLPSVQFFSSYAEL